LEIELEAIQAQLARRRPGQSAIVTQRKEEDQVEILSGVFEGRSTGTPIALWIPNKDQRSKDYSHVADRYRPSHADYTYQVKYGHRDYRGGGRSSARETAARVAAGAVAQKLLEEQGIKIWAWVDQVGDFRLRKSADQMDLSLIESNPVRCPDPEAAAEMESLIREVRKAGDTIGGCIQGLCQGVPPGWGEPVFAKLHADLAGAMMGINASRGFEYGSGFGAVSMRGSQHNDPFFIDDDGQVRTSSNHSGGIQGGISNGMDIPFRIAFKPVATIIPAQESINEKGERVEVVGKGRHDPCVLPRAVPIVEAMAALVLADHYLRYRAQGKAE
jgi:chorismate synthase